jgi:hypothetical protein
VGVVVFQLDYDRVRIFYQTFDQHPLLHTSGPKLSIYTLNDSYIKDHIVLKLDLK